MNIISKVVGDLQENCYIVYEKKDAVVIDPGADAQKILDILKEKDLNLTHILLTHGHFDHIGAVGEIKSRTGAQICIHFDDSDMLVSPQKNLSVFIGETLETYPADMYLYDGQIIETGGMRIKVLATPGHTPGGVSFEIGDNLFTGDTLFRLSVGRTDFPGSSTVKLNHSLTEVLGNLKKNYFVYPGHGPASTLDEEKEYNPFMRIR
jgi:glyoxylase-like metal-dependent hydrolase (beta-lactamase superfamily II)